MDSEKSITDIYNENNERLSRKCDKIKDLYDNSLCKELAREEAIRLSMLYMAYDKQKLMSERKIYEYIDKKLLEKK